MTTRTNPMYRPDRGLRRHIAVLALAVAVAPLLAACGHGSAAGPASTSSPTTAPPTATATPAPPSASTAPVLKTIPVPAATRRQAKKGTRAYLAATAAVLADPNSKTKPAGGLVTGAALVDLLTMKAQYDDQNYRVKGRAKVLSERVVRRLDKPRRLVVLVCVDNSGVKVLDKHGKQVVGSSTVARSLNLLTLRRVGNHWVVSQSSFPANPTC